MPTNTWSAGADGVWSANANWSLGVTPVIGDDVVFNNTSIKKCTVDIDPSINSLTIAATYTGIFDMTGHTITVAGNVSDLGITNAHNYGNGFICNGNNSSIVFNPTIAPTASSAVLTLNGTVGMTLNTGAQLGATNCFKQVVFGASAIVTMAGGIVLQITGTVPAFIFGLGSSFTSSGTIYLNPNGSTDLWTLLGTVVGTTFNVGFNGMTIKFNANGITVSLPAINITGAGGITVTSILTTYTGLIARLTGDVTLAGTFTFTGTVNGGRSCDFDLNNYNLTCTTLSVYAGAGGTTAFNCRRGIVTCTIFATLANATLTINFHTSRWFVSGNISLYSANVLNNGSAIINIINTCSLTSGTLTLPILAINAIGKIVTLADNLLCINFWYFAGTINLNGKTLATQIKNPAFSPYFHISPDSGSTFINLLSIPVASIR